MMDVAERRGTGVYVLETQMAVAGVVMMTDHGHGSIRESPSHDDAIRNAIIEAAIKFLN